MMPAILRAVCRFALGAIAGSTKAKKSGAAPGRAGDGARNRRETGIGRSLPVEAIAPDGDGVALAMIVADQHRPRFKGPTRWATLSCQTVEERQTVAIKTAE